MPLPRAVAQRLGTATTVLSALVALGGALAMRDRVRLVDILALFFGGLGTGAGIAERLMRRRLAARDQGRPGPDAPRDAAWPLPPSVPGSHTPPTVPWRSPPAPPVGRGRPPA